MDSKTKFEQKLDYLHNNPLQERCDLVNYPEEYKWSSAEFYLEEQERFGILTH